VSSLRPSPTGSAGSSRRLGAILDGQRELFEELAGLAREFRKALTDADADTLTLLGDRAETLATQFHLLEVERIRLEECLAEPSEHVERARSALLEALRTLLREGAVSGTVLDRLTDTAAARQAAVATLFGSAYLADGRSAPWRVQGAGLSAEG